MSNREHSPFKAHADWACNACVSSYMQFTELGDYYVRAGDALVQRAISDQSLLDVYIYPLCFLYRHGIELILKDWLWKSNYVAHGKKSFPKKHRLSELWQALSANSRTLLGSDFPLTDQEIKMLQQALAQIEEHDPGGDAFRYPIDRKGQWSHSSLTHVNVRSLYESVHQVVDWLGDLGGLLAYYYERTSEYEAEQEQEDGHWRVW